MYIVTSANALHKYKCQYSCESVSHGKDKKKQTYVVHGSIESSGSAVQSMRVTKRALSDD